MKVYIYPNLTRDRTKKAVYDICAELKRLDIPFALDVCVKSEFPGLEAKNFESPEFCLGSCDIIMPVGGDGTVISASELCKNEKPKILAVNSGHLGYLCDVDSSDLSVLSKLVSGDYGISRRMRIKCEHYINGAAVKTMTALNDVIVARGRDLKLSEISVFADGKKVSDYLADGIVFATPTGSTAYSMSAGGPVVSPDVGCITVTPVCPHFLASRPLIFSSDTVLSVTFRKRSADNELFFSVDGSSAVPLTENSEIRISDSKDDALFINLSSLSFAERLNKKISQLNQQ